MEAFSAKLDVVDGRMTHPSHLVSGKQLKDHEKQKPSSKTVSPQLTNQRTEAGFASL